MTKSSDIVGSLFKQTSENEVWTDDVVSAKTGEYVNIILSLDSSKLL